MGARTPEDVDPLWAEAFNKGDADAVFSLYEADGVLVLPTGEAISGAEALLETANRFLAMKPTIDLHTRKIISAGDVALLYSPWTMSATGEDGSPVTMAGDATLVVRRQGDGNWLIAIDDPGWLTS